MGCATAGVATLVALTIAEALSRRLYAENFQVLGDSQEDHPYRPFLATRQTWGENTYPFYTNSLGWKDSRPGRRVSRDPAPLKRVILLGDSFTEGVGFPAEKTAAGFAERRLNEDGERPSLAGWVRPGLEALERHLLRIRQLAASRGAALWLVLYPWPQMLSDETPQRDDRRCKP